MSQLANYIVLGNISGVHGLKGWLKIFSHTSPRVEITEYSHWFLRKKSGSWEEFKVIAGRAQGKNIIAQLDGVSDRNQVEALVGSEIAIKEKQLASLPDGKYYWKDLLGLSVETTEGINLGKIDWIFNSGSNDVLVVKDVDLKKERLLPFLYDSVVISIDMEESLIVVDWDSEF